MRVSLVRTTLAGATLAILAACGGSPGTASGDASGPPATSTPAPAGLPGGSARQAVMDAGKRLFEASSFQVNVQMAGPNETMEGQFVAPDRYRMRTPMGVQTVIGSKMYVEMGGQAIVMDAPPGTIEQWREMGDFEPEAGIEVVDEGADAVDGNPARRYRIVDAGVASSHVWIDADGLPLQVRAVVGEGEHAVTTQLRYSRINDPTIRIEAPAP